MKILKLGKVEMRKFVCQKCGCVFTAEPDDVFWVDGTAHCPRGGCDCDISWDSGEPYEEPTPTQTDRERLITVLHKNWPMDNEFADSVASTLLENGMTFREECN